MDPSITGLPEGQLIVDRDTFVSLEKEVLEIPAQIRVESITRYNNQDGDVALEDIPPHEQPHVLVFLGLQESEKARLEVLVADAEQLVLWERLEDLGNHLVVVRAWKEIFLCEDGAELALEDRDRRRCLHICLGSEQANEAGLALRRAVGVGAAHPT